MDIGAVDFLAVSVVRDKFADVLSRAAAEVEGVLVGVAEAGDEGGEVRGELDGKI